MKKLINFFKESFDELKKVTWPNKDQAVSSAMMVIAFLVGFSLFLSILDYLVKLLLEFIVKM